MSINTLSSRFKGNKHDLSGAANTLAMVALPLIIFGCMAALNGGTAMSSSAFDPVVAWFKTLLSSSYVIMIATVVLVVVIWELGNGGGYRRISSVIAILTIALVGPGFLTSISTAMPPSAFLKAQVSHHAISLVAHQQSSYAHHAYIPK